MWTLCPVCASSPGRCRLRPRDCRPYRRLGSGGERLGSSSPAREGWPAFRSPCRIPEVEQGFRANAGPCAWTTCRSGKGHWSIRGSPEWTEVTVNRTPGTWFARCCVEAGEGLPAVQSGPTIGVDVGVGLMATCRDCGDWTRPSPAVGTSTAAAITPTGARSRTPGDGDVLGWHARVVNARNDHYHKATTAIAQSSARVVVETLKASGMIRNRRLSRAIADAGTAGFPTKPKSQCTWYGAEFVKADRWFASSKLCAHCGWKNDDLHLRYRQWRCGGCGPLNEPDHNAAMHLSNWPGLSFPLSGHGDRVSPTTPAVVGEASTAAPGQSPIESLEQTG